MVSIKCLGRICSSHNSQCWRKDKYFTKKYFGKICHPIKLTRILFVDANLKKNLQILFKIKDIDFLSWDCWAGNKKFLEYWYSVHLISSWMFIKLYTSDLSTFLYRCDTSKYIHTHHKEKQGKDKCKIQNSGYQWEMDTQAWGAFWRSFTRKRSVPCFKLGGGHVLYIVYIPTEVLL